MATSRSTYHHGDLRAELLRTVDAVLRDAGPDALSLREVSRRAGVSHAAAYKHFADKGELLAVYAAAGFDELTRALEAARARAATPAAILAELGVAYVRFAFDRPAAFRVMFRSQAVDAGDAGVVTAGARARAQLEAAVAAARDDGLLAAESLEAQVLAAWSLVHGLACLVLDGSMRDVARDAGAVEALARTVVAAYLRARTSGAS